MAQLNDSLVRSILEGSGVTRWEIEQLCHRWLQTSTTTPQPAAADGGVRELPSVAAFASAIWRDWMTNEQADKLGTELHAWLSAHFATALSSHRQAGDVLCHRVRFQGDSVCPGGPVWRAGDIPASELAYWEAAGSHYWIERAYDYPPDPATLTRVHRLLENWERQAQLHGVRTFTGNDHLIFANELRAALVEKGAGNG